MDFVNFVRAHGIVIDSLPPIGRWVRLPTVSHPKKRNGAVKYMGDHGFCQEHATMQDVATWKSEGESPVALQAMKRSIQEAADHIARGNAKAAERAQWILSQCVIGRHPYLERKGFPEEPVNVWNSDAGVLLVVPMRVGAQLVGCQLIDEHGAKKFLTGQRCSHAQYVFTASNGPHIVCEGFATGLSVRNAMKSIKRPYTLHVCFSAGNMKKLAEGLPGGLVIADNDASGTGERTAQEIGWPYWMSDRVGEDANDAHQRLGLFAVSMQLNKLMLMQMR